MTEYRFNYFLEINSKRGILFPFNKMVDPHMPNSLLCVMLEPYPCVGGVKFRVLLLNTDEGTDEDSLFIQKLFQNWA